MKNKLERLDELQDDTSLWEIDPYDGYHAKVCTVGDIKERLTPVPATPSNKEGIGRQIAVCNHSRATHKSQFHLVPGVYTFHCPDCGKRWEE